MSRIERLVNLTAALLATERALTADEIRERVPGYPDEKASFRRQFERDKDALRELGLPLLLETQGSGSEEQPAYRIDADRYYLRDPGLTPDELSALHLASRMVRVEGLTAGDGMWKLAADRLDALGQTEPADESAPDAVIPAAEALAAMFQAIAEGRSVTFTYRTDGRRAVPRSLAFRTGHWYLSAYDLDRSDERSFRLDRIDGAVELGEPTQAPASTRTQLRSHPWELGYETPVEALVRIDAVQAPWVIRHLGTEAVRERHEDGSAAVALTVSSADAFRSFVLGFLDGAEVLEPPHLRAFVTDWLRSIAQDPASAIAGTH